MQQNETIRFDNKIEDDIPGWKLLDDVMRKWAVLSGFEKDQERYAKLKEYYE
jgi:hypothetical protein